MELFNQVATLLMLALCAVSLSMYTHKRMQSRRRLGLDSPAGAPSRADRIIGSFLRRYHVWLVAAVMIVAVGIRFWQFPNIPPGLNQDEASIAYDSWAIGNFGVDRNGDRFPVYPIAFGDGHGPLYTYLSIPAIRLFGLNITAFRLTNCLLSCIAVFIFYLLVKKIAGNTAGLCAMALLATCPASVISARWALDGNPLPSVFLIAAYVFMLASIKQKTWLYMLSAAVFALTVYCYGPAGVVTPLFLLFACLYLIYHKKLRWPQFALGIAAFLVVFAPLGLFLAVNAFDWPAIRTSFLSFPKFTVARSGSVFIQPDGNYLKNLADNVWSYVGLVILQTRQDLIWNVVPGFGTTYPFTAPLILAGMAGLAAETRRLKRYNPRLLMLVYFLAATVMCLLIWPNVNRISILFPAIVFLIVMALRFVYRQMKVLACVACLLVAVGFGLFTYNYFHVYPETFGAAFFDSFGEALTDAKDRTDGTIYVTELHQNEPHVIALFYSGVTPQRFVDTVKYYDDFAEWRNAMYFDRYKFGIPEVIDSFENAVYVIHPAEADRFDPELFHFEVYKYYIVAYPDP